MDKDKTIQALMFAVVHMDNKASSFQYVTGLRPDYVFEFEKYFVSMIYNEVFRLEVHLHDKKGFHFKMPSYDLIRSHSKGVPKVIRLLNRVYDFLQTHLIKKAPGGEPPMG